MKKVIAEVPSEWRREWPCSRLAGRTITAGFAPNGDLVELENVPEDTEGAELDSVLEKYGIEELEQEAIDLAVNDCQLWDNLPESAREFYRAEAIEEAT